ncbi:MAG TPA: hypothetical protein VF954_03455 [Acidimicrobiales bacterium]
MPSTRRSRPALDRLLAFDEDAAEAVAVMTLLSSGRPEDQALGASLLADLLARPNGAERAGRGLASVAGGLLALLEFYGGVPPAEALRELGRLVAEAVAAE